MMKSFALAVALSALVLAGCANYRPKGYDYSARMSVESLVGITTRMERGSLCFSAE